MESDTADADQTIPGSSSSERDTFDFNKQSFIPTYFFMKRNKNKSGYNKIGFKDEIQGSYSSSRVI